VRSTLTYEVSGEQFAKNRFVVHYADQSRAPSRASLGLPAGKWAGTGTLFVCEGGILFAEPEGYPKIWIDGKPVDYKSLPGLGTVAERNHWHSWVDKILGKPDAFVQTPFSYGARIAEAGSSARRRRVSPARNSAGTSRRSPSPTTRRQRKRSSGARSIGRASNCRRLRDRERAFACESAARTDRHQMRDSLLR
jgi:hypothetical protein